MPMVFMNVLSATNTLLQTSWKLTTRLLGALAEELFSPMHNCFAVRVILEKVTNKTTDYGGVMKRLPQGLSSLVAIAVLNRFHVFKLINEVDEWNVINRELFN